MEGLTQAQFDSLCEIYEADRREMELLVASYDGGSASSNVEDKENEKKSLQEEPVVVQYTSKISTLSKPDFKRTFHVKRRLRAKNEENIRLLRGADHRLKVFFQRNEVTGSYYAQLADFSLPKEERKLTTADVIELSCQLARNEYRSMQYAENEIPDRLEMLEMLDELLELVSEVEGSWPHKGSNLHFSCLLTFTSSAEGLLISYVRKGSVRGILDIITMLLPQFGEASVKKTSQAIIKEFSRLVRIAKHHDNFVPFFCKYFDCTMIKWQ